MAGLTFRGVSVNCEKWISWAFTLPIKAMQTKIKTAMENLAFMNNSLNSKVNEKMKTMQLISPIINNFIGILILLG